MRSVFHRVGRTVGFVLTTGVERADFMGMLAIIDFIVTTALLFEPPVWAGVLLLLGGFALLVLFGLILLSLSGNDVACAAFARDEGDFDGSAVHAIARKIKRKPNEI